MNPNAQARTHRERPYKRPDNGKWVARYTDWDGTRRSNGTFKRRRDAQDAITEAYLTRGKGLPPWGLSGAPATVGEYAKTWTTRHPRSKRTNHTNDHRLSRVLDVTVEGRPFRDWPLAEVKRRHINELVGAMLGSA